MGTLLKIGPIRLSRTLVRFVLDIGNLSVSYYEKPRLWDWGFTLDIQINFGPLGIFYKGKR